MDFGLGLILSFTDNATAGINSAVLSLSQLTDTANSASASLNQMASLTAFSSIATNIGNSMTSAGGAIISTLGQVIGKVNDTGKTLMYAENQLNKLYEGGSRTGKEVLGDISEYAKQSIFEFENLIPVVTMLKANGIEAFDTITSSSGKSAQTLMDYAADLAAFNPAMHNAYGSGIQAAMGALNEYIAEGNARSLKSGASLDITGLLGEEKGKTIEERSRQVADLLEQLNMVGMTASLAETPMVKLSNMSDTLFQFLGMISNSGVYDQFNRIISIFADFVNNIPDERLQAIADIIGSSLSAILKPLEFVAEKIVAFADALMTLLENNPGLAKFATIAVAAGGALLVFGGVILKVLGSMGYLALMLKSLNSSFSTIGTVMKMGVRKVLGAMLPLTLALGAMYLTWKYDLFGIRTALTTFVKGVQNSFKTARTAVTGSLADMRAVLSSFDTKHSFFDGLTLAIMRVMVLFQALSEGWNDFTLSEDTFLKAKELGILPLIQALFDLKYRFDQFKTGFIEGLQVVSDKVKSFFAFLADKFDGTIFETLLNKITGFFQLLSNNDPAAWQNAGKIIGEVAASLILVAGAVKILSLVTKPFRSAGGIISTIIGGGKGGSSGGGAAASGGFLSSPLTVLKTMTSIAIILGGIAILITAFGALVSNPYLSTFLTNGVNMIPKLLENILPLAGGVAVLAVLFKALDLIKLSPATALKGLANLAIILLGFEVVITAMGALASIPGFSNFISTGAETMTKLFSVLEGMFNPKALAVIALIAAFGLVPVQVTALGLANLAIVLAGMTALISAFSALSMIPGFDDFISRGGDTLANLFTQIGRIVGSLIGGFATGVTDALPAIGTNISGFATNIQPFFDVVQNAPTEKVAPFVDALGRFILFAAGEQLLAFFTGGLDLVSIAQQLAQFGVTVQPFFDAVAGYPDAGIEKAPRVFDALTSIGNYAFRSGGVAQFFTGEVNLANIGQQLASAAPGFSTFFNTVAGFPDDGIEKAPKVFDAITSIGSYAFRSGGVAQFFTGEVDIAGIASQLATAAPSLSTFFSSAASFSDKGIENAPKVFDALTSIGNYSYRSGGLAQFFTGEVDISGIASQLASAAPDLGTFFNTVAGYSTTGLTRAPQVFEALNAIGDYDFKSGGVAQWFTGTTNLKDIGTQLTQFGEAAKGFFDTMGQVSQSGMTNGQLALECLTNLGEFKSGGLVDLFAGTIDLVSIGTQLSSFATNIKPFFTTTGTITTTSITRATEIFTALSEIGDYAFRTGGVAQLFTGTTDLSSMGEDLATFAENIKPFFETAGTISSSSIYNAKQMFTALDGAGDLVGVAAVSNGKLSSFGEELVSFADSFTQFLDKVGTIGDTSGIGALTEALSTLDSIFGTFSGTISTNASTITTSMSNIQTSFSDTAETTKTSFSDMETSLTTFSSTFTSVNSSVSSSAATLQATVSTLVANVSANLRRLSSAFASTTFRFTQTHIAVPHFSMSGSFNAETKQVPKVSVSWYGHGGIFDSPNIIGVGEAGTEAVMPLERNTEWIGLLAHEIVDNMPETQLIPTNTVNNTNTTQMGDEDTTYMTTSGGNTHYDGDEIDNRVIFEEGAIVIHVAKASEDEAERLANLIMEKLKRKKELERMMQYQPVR